MLFCSMMHFASGVFAWAFLQVRRKPVRLCHLNVYVLQGTLSNKALYGQNCVSPEWFILQAACYTSERHLHP